MLIEWTSPFGIRAYHGLWVAWPDPAWTSIIWPKSVNSGQILRPKPYPNHKKVARPIPRCKTLKIIWLPPSARNFCFNIAIIAMNTIHIFIILIYHQKYQHTTVWLIWLQNWSKVKPPCQNSSIYIFKRVFWTFPFRI